MSNYNSKFKDLISNEWLLLLLIIVYFLNVFGSIVQYLVLLIIPILIVKDVFWRYIDSMSIWIVVFSFSYILISNVYGFNSGGSLITFSVFPLLFYLVGRYLMDNWYSQKFILLLLLILPIGLMVVGGIFMDVFNNGFINMSRNVEVNGQSLPSTLDGVRLSLYIASFGMIFALSQNGMERFLKYLLFALGIIGIVCTIHMLNRTGLVIALVSCLTVLFVNFRRFKWRNILIGLVLMSVAGFELYPTFNKFKVVNYYSEREDESGANTAGGRTGRWETAIEKIFSQPLGGGVFNQRGRRFYAHNFWLDVSEIAGVLPFIALVGCTLINLWKNFKIIKSRQITPFLASWIITLNIGFFLACFVEPIMEGMAAFAFLYFFFWGMTSIMYDRIKNAENQLV